MTKNFMRELALRGARYVLLELEKEKLAIYRAFPELLPADEQKKSSRGKQKKRTWTDAQRKAQSERLKAMHRVKKA